MGPELETVRQLGELNPIPDAIIKSVDMAWAVYRKGQIPDDYLICREMLWDEICQIRLHPGSH